MTFEKQCSVLHNPVNPLAVDRGTPLFGQFPVYHRRDTAIAIDWPRVDEASDQRQHDLYRFRLGRTVVRLGCSSPSADRFDQQAASTGCLLIDQLLPGY